MGSLRKPVGPLPSSIYWQRRTFLLTVVALLALLVAWTVISGGGGRQSNTNGYDGKNPAPSIIPGPGGSGPAIGEAPGGREESVGGGDTTGSGGASGSGGGSGDGFGSGDGSDSGDFIGGTGESDGSGGADSASGGQGSGNSGEQVPAGSRLPDCTASAVKLTVRSVRNEYAPGEEPAFELIARNSSGSDCKVDLGPKKTVLTITQDGDDLWSSADCPEGTGSLLFRVPAEGSAAYTVKWDRRASSLYCATPSGGSAPAGTYLVEAKAPGLAKTWGSFMLTKD